MRCGAWFPAPPNHTAFATSTDAQHGALARCANSHLCLTAVDASGLALLPPHDFRSRANIRSSPGAAPLSAQACASCRHRLPPQAQFHAGDDRRRPAHAVGHGKNPDWGLITGIAPRGAALEEPVRISGVWGRGRRGRWWSSSTNGWRSKLVRRLGQHHHGRGVQELPLPTLRGRAADGSRRGSAPRWRGLHDGFTRFLVCFVSPGATSTCNGCGTWRRVDENCAHWRQGLARTPSGGATGRSWSSSKGAGKMPWHAGTRVRHGRPLLLARRARHLYPHNAAFDPRGNTPSPGAPRPGRFVVVSDAARHSITAEEKKLRFEGGPGQRGSRAGRTRRRAVQDHLNGLRRFCRCASPLASGHRDAPVAAPGRDRARCTG